MTSPILERFASSRANSLRRLNTLLRDGAGVWDDRYLNAQRMEHLVVGKMIERILNERAIDGLVEVTGLGLPQTLGKR